QVLLNLLNNAAKFTPSKGHIRLDAEREGNEVVIRVRDDGIGIAPEMLPHVFSMFMQVDKSLERSTGGLGVGLNLAHRLVQLHAGRIEVASAGPGQGSEFTVRLPLAAAATPLPAGNTVAERAPAPVAGRRILVVDDNQDTAQSLAMMLRMK